MMLFRKDEPLYPRTTVFHLSRILKSRPTFPLKSFPQSQTFQGTFGLRENWTGWRRFRKTGARALMVPAGSLPIWNHCFRLRPRSHCRRSRWNSGLPPLASPDTESCPSLRGRCQSWWDHLRADEKASLITVGGFPSPPRPRCAPFCLR